MIEKFNSFSKLTRALVYVLVSEVIALSWGVTGFAAYGMLKQPAVQPAAPVAVVATPPTAVTETTPAEPAPPPTQTSAKQAPTTKPAPEPQPLSSGTVEVRGDASCQTQVGAALSMLQTGAPTHYALANQYLCYIDCAAVGSSIDSTQKCVHFTMGQATLEAGTLWVAGIIAHEYCHPKLYHDGQVYEGREGESKCLEVQYNALEQMGADPNLLDYVKNLADTEWWNDPNDWW